MYVYTYRGKAIKHLFYSSEEIPYIISASQEHKLFNIMNSCSQAFN